MGKPASSVECFWDRPLHELFELLPATPAGLTTEEVRRRLRLYGPNSLVHESRFAALLSFFGFFRNPVVVILVIASGVSLALGEHVGGLIILAIVLFSVILNFRWRCSAIRREPTGRGGKHPEKAKCGRIPCAWGGNAQGSKTG